MAPRKTSHTTKSQGQDASGTSAKRARRTKDDVEIDSGLERFATLQPQEVILGLFGEYVTPGERAWSGGLVRLMQDLGFLASASRVAFNRVIARGLLQPTKEGRFAFYSITPRLEIVHEEGRRRTFTTVVDPEWSGLWTLVWYNIPENQRLQRGRFGRWLSLGGFGSLQDGTWICAGDRRDDVVALAKRLGLEEHVVVLVGKLGDDAESRRLARHAWKTEDLAKLYEVFIAEFKAFLKPSAYQGLQASQAFVLRTRLIDMYRRLSVLDPQIPDRILGVKWRRREAIEMFQELQTVLRPKASSYFRTLVMTGDEHNGDPKQ